MLLKIYNLYYALGDPSVLIDIILTGLIIALVAALGYTFLSAQCKPIAQNYYKRKTMK